jgi:hypothetical protein
MQRLNRLKVKSLEIFVTGIAEISITIDLKWLEFLKRNRAVLPILRIR